MVKKKSKFSRQHDKIKQVYFIGVALFYYLSALKFSSLK